MGGLCLVINKIKIKLIKLNTKGIAEIYCEIYNEIGAIGRKNIELKIGEPIELTDLEMRRLTNEP